MHSEIKETVFIAVSAILLASVLTLFVSGLRLRDSFASTRNEQILANHNIKDFRQFNKYNGLSHKSNCDKDMSGWAVIIAIQEYCNVENFTIYVDRDKNENKLQTDGVTEFDLSELQNRFNSTAKYHPMLVYNWAEPKEITAPQNIDSNSVGSGIKFTLVH